METAEHILVARGPSVAAGKPKPEAAGSILRLVGTAVRDAASMGFRNASRVHGRRPDWLRRASDVRLTQVSREDDEATRFHFVAPRFRSAAPEVYDQQVLFGMRPNDNDTAIDLLGDVLKDIANRNRDSNKFDSDLLRRFEAFGGRAFHGVNFVKLSGDRLSEDQPPVLDRQVAALAADLFQQTPAPNRTRVAGKLDMIRHHDRVFTIVLDGGQEIRGVWCADNLDTLQQLFGTDVVAEGMAMYRPSGSLLRLDAEAMNSASDKDHVFSQVPRPSAMRLVPGDFRQIQTHTSGARAIYGRWPGDESEDNILAGLKELRR